MERQKEAETFNDKELDKDWRDSVNMVSQYAGNSQKVLTALAEFQENWDGRLGCLEMTKQHINIPAPDLRLINFAPYRTGLKAREIEKSDIDKMLNVNAM